MERSDDPNLTELLREWQVPNAPLSLDARVLGQQRSRWSFFLTGYIRVPVPVGLAIVVIVVAVGGALIRAIPPQPIPAPVNLIDFRPVSNLNVRVIHESD